MRKSVVVVMVGGLLLATLAGPIAAQSKPAAKELKVFLRYDVDSAGDCGTTYLSLEDAPDEGNGCAFTFQPAQEALIASGQAPLVVEWPGLLPKPVKVLAGTAKGSFTINSDVAAPQATIEVELRAVTSRGSVTIGNFTSETFTAAPAQPALVEFEMAIPKGLVNQKIESVSLSTTLRGVAAQTYIELDAPAAFITLPAK